MSSTSSNEKLHIPPGGEKPLCVVCGEFTDGQHFGKFSCRACAAFFRRTVAHNLKYVCKFNQNCEISKDVRNFCRFCRYRKCVAAGMITDAVQSHRDTYGKRNLPSLEDSPPKISKDYHPSSFFLSPTDNSVFNEVETKALSYPQFSTAISTVPSSSSSTTTTPSFTLFPDKTYPILETLQPAHLLPLFNHSNNQKPPQTTFNLKHLPKMVEGYQKFRSLRKASYSLFMDEPRFINSESVPESTYSNNKKSCQVESSLAYDMIMEYFEPFSQNKLFENFQGLLSCGEKGYNTCKAYGTVENNDRLIMTDGGYVKLGELSKYYSNSSEVNGDPEEVAR
uniref:Nuclear receptor domain-containing protein n=1 Tax=Panagrolaimus superbus TaxID=310955 RepID=A0A914Z4K6_9BILA